jgi:3-hydroxyacyl-CoA dehydrogenase
MGGGIAAQLANAGWQVKLLDVAGQDPNPRNAPAEAGLERLLRARPPLLFLPEYSARIEIGNTEDHLHWLRDADWVVEAVAERMDVKQALLAQVEASCGPQTVVTSNTSGLSLREMSSERSESFRSRFLGSHFLNPPRYLKLLEVVPLESTEAAVAEGFVRFAEQVLGHRVVIAKDTPGFISTRIWIMHLVSTMKIALKQGLTIEEADYLTGRLLGRPNSATFRMADIVGLDIVAAIAGNQFAALPDDPFRDNLLLPVEVRRSIDQGRLGDKSGAGFYRREGKSIFTQDLTTGEYRPREEVRIPEVEALLKRPIAERLAAMKGERQARWGRFVNAILDSLRDYVEYAGPLVAADVLSVDNVMRWGFQWALGPFEIEDLRSGKEHSYRGSGSVRRARVFGSAEMWQIQTEPEYLTLADRKAGRATVFETPDGALIDLGDGVACIELRTKLNTFSPGVCELVRRALEIADSGFAALVVGTDGPHFSAGYNLKLLLDTAVSAHWAAIDTMLQEVQSAFQAVKYSAVPVVAAVRGYTLGAGCECALHCAAIQAGPELTMGLPEVSAGLVPGGGGIKELLARAMATWDGNSDAGPLVESVLRLVAFGKTSANAHEARRLGFLREADGISRNADRLLFDAKTSALALAAAGYHPPERVGITVLGSAVLPRLEAIVAEGAQGDSLSEHDRLIASKVARILAGGTAPGPRVVSEEELLALEREALISLSRTPTSQDRMRVLLETGKPLKN